MVQGSISQSTNMKPNISLKLLENNTQIQTAIVTALLPQVDKYMSKVAGYINANISELIREAIVSQPEYQALIGGSLKLELGIPDPEIRIADIINIWINNIDVSYQKPKIVSNRIKSSISIKAIKSNFSDVLVLDAATIVDSVSGSTVSWLEWLLLDGSAIIIKDHEVVFGPNDRSRTGFAVMQFSPQSSWGVPSEYAGTQENNWITRAINSYTDQINKLLYKAMSQ